MLLDLRRPDIVDWKGVPPPGEGGLLAVAKDIMIVEDETDLTATSDEQKLPGKGRKRRNWPTIATRKRAVSSHYWVGGAPDAERKKKKKTVKPKKSKSCTIIKEPFPSAASVESRNSAGFLTFDTAAMRLREELKHARGQLGHPMPEIPQDFDSIANNLRAQLNESPFDAAPGPPKTDPITDSPVLESRTTLIFTEEPEPSPHSPRKRPPELLPERGPELLPGSGQGLPATTRQKEASTLPSSIHDKAPTPDSSLPAPALLLSSPAKPTLAVLPPSPHISSQRQPNKSSTKKQPATFLSPFFPAPTISKPPKPLPGLPITPIPPLSCPTFGLIQEKLSRRPFHLLIAVTFLIKTAGRTALPMFWKFIGLFPTPESLASEEVKERIEEFVKPLGLGRNRTAIIQKYARGWLENPPTKGKRFGVRGYGTGAGDVKDGEEFGSESEEEVEEGEAAVLDKVKERKERGLGSAWEIGHLTKGAYALDSWRIFCRDELLGRSKDWKGDGERTQGFQPEWMRILPGDKELRGCLRWMWMREGWEWDPVTGEKEPLREEMRMAVDQGRVGYDEGGGLVILDRPVVQVDR